MSRLLRKIEELRRDTSGNALILSAFALTVLIGAAGLATDTIQWTLWKRQLQRQADSGALAGALTNAQGGSASTSATAEINRYNLLTLSSAPVIEVGPTAGPYAGNTRAVRVALQTSRTLPFSSFFTSATPIINAEATAAAVSFGDYCVISLESTAATGITMGGSSIVNMGCGMATNSQSSTAVYAGGSSYITASPIAAVGGIPNTSNFASGTTIIPYTIAQPDPYARLPTPTPSSCSGELNVNPNNTRNISNSGGVSCYRGMDLKGTVNFAPGVYYIDGSNGGSLNIGSQAVVNAPGAVFILTTTSTDYSTVATVNMNGGATLNMTAPTTGTYAGIMIYQDRRASLGPNNYITGTSNSTFQGAVYMPSQAVQFTGDSGMNTNCLQLVARQVTFTGNNIISNVCPANSGSTSISGIQIRLVN